MSLRHCFLYIENNPNPSLIEEILKRNCHEVWKANDHLYFFTGERSAYSTRFFSLEEGTLLAIQDGLAARGMPPISRYLTGPASECLDDFSDIPQLRPHDPSL